MRPRKTSKIVTGHFSVQRDLREVSEHRNVSDNKASNLGVFYLSLEKRLRKV